MKFQKHHQDRLYMHDEDIRNLRQEINLLKEHLDVETVEYKDRSTGYLMYDYKKIISKKK